MGKRDGQKEVDPQVLERSVVEIPPEPAEGQPPTTSPLLFFIAQVADEFTAWGRAPKQRDKELREFIPKESLFSSALGIVCARNAAFSWMLEGPPLTVNRFQEIFESANFGRGWHNLILNVSFDLYSQDTGAFIEVVRSADSPQAPLIGLNHLDAARCFHTGSPESPVIYEDQKGVFHRLKWWNVLALSEMPVPGAKGLQVCAESRLLLAAQIVRNIAIYRMEKVGGRNTKAIHLIKGITSGEVQDAIEQTKAKADAAGLFRYMTPVIVGSKDPQADVGHDTLDLASLPDGFDEDKMYKWYIAQIAMAFLTDYQEFAPLPGGNLGTSTQSEILHLKSRGKGPGLFMKLVSHALNFLVLPQNVTFRFDEQDLEAELAEAEIGKLRAETRKVRVESGELTPEAARQQALDAGDLSQELFDALGGADLTPNVTVDDEAKVPPAREPETERVEEGEKAERAGPFDEERLAAERKLASTVERTLARIRARVVKRLRLEASKELLVGSKALSDLPEDEAFWGLQREELLRATSGQTHELLQAGVSQAERLGLATSFEMTNEQVLSFAGRYQDEWWRALDATTRRGLRTAIQANISTGAPLSSLIEAIQPLFGRSRAQAIASTEVTRLYTQGNLLAYQATGIEEVEWRTVKDARVDPICEALAGQRWPAQQVGQEPPAHVGCRCWLSPVVRNRPITQAEKKEQAAVEV